MPSSAAGSPEIDLAVASAQDPEVDPVLDLHVYEFFAELGDGGVGFARLREIFVRSSADSLQELEAAAAHPDRPALERSAHALASSAAAIGALRLCTLCRGLERLAPTAEAPAVGRRVAEVAAELGRVREALDELTPRSPERGTERSVR